MKTVLSFNRPFSKKAPPEKIGNYELAEKAIVRACKANGKVSPERLKEKVEKFRAGFRECRQCHQYKPRDSFLGARCNGCVKLREEFLANTSKKYADMAKYRHRRYHGVEEGWCARLGKSDWHGPFKDYNLLYNLALSIYSTESRVPESFEIERIGSKGVLPKEVKAPPEHFEEVLRRSTSTLD